MANKILQQQIKTILSALADEDLERLFGILSAEASEIEKQARMVSYKCYEVSIIFKGKKSNGYGRSETEANSNAIKNFVEGMLEAENNINILRSTLKKLSEEKEAGKQKFLAKIPSSYEVQCLPVDPGINQIQQMTAENETLLEQSYDTMKGDIEALGKKIGNISIIKDPKFNNSQLEIDDILLKLMLEDGGNSAAKDSNKGSQNPATQQPQSHNSNNTIGDKSLTATCSAFASFATHQYESNKAKTASLYHSSNGAINAVEDKPSFAKNNCFAANLESSFEKMSKIQANYKSNRARSNNGEHQVPSPKLSRNTSKSPFLRESEKYEEADSSSSESRSFQKVCCHHEKELVRAKERILYLESYVKSLKDEIRALKSSKDGKPLPGSSSGGPQTSKMSPGRDRKSPPLSIKENPHDETDLWSKRGGIQRPPKTNGAGNVINLQRETSAIYGNSNKENLERDRSEKTRSVSVDVQAKRAKANPITTLAKQASYNVEDSLASDDPFGSDPRNNQSKDAKPGPQRLKTDAIPNLQPPQLFKKPITGVSSSSTLMGYGSQINSLQGGSGFGNYSNKLSSRR